MMRSVLFRWNIFVGLVAASASGAWCAPLEIGMQNQVFIDGRLLAERENVDIVVQQPRKTGEMHPVTWVYLQVMENDGVFKKGLIKAELDIKDNLWFFECHFKDDSVMPGCLGLDAMWQLVGFYLGWLGNPGRGRALGVNSVKFTGEVLKNVKMATYVIDIKRILIKEGTTVGLANGVLLADGKKIYSAENLKVGLFK